MRPIRRSSAPRLAGVLVLVATLLVPATTSAQSLDEVRAERGELQERLDEVADELAAAEDRVAEAESRTAELETQAAAIEDEVATLRAGVEDQLAALFKRGSVRDPLTVFLSSDDPREALFWAEALRYAVTGDVGAVDQLAADQDRLAAVRGRLAEEQQRLDDAVAEQEGIVAELEADLERAAELEQRLEREARERREAEERARREAEERARRVAEDEAADAPAGASSGEAAGGTSSGGSSSGGSSSSGGRAATSGGMACPVGQPRSFSDTWGAPRSGGRSHRGTDILAPYGTPVYAIVDGTWSIQSPGRSAGLWAILRGSDGNHYWYLHLQSHTVGNGASVSAGQQVGTNGDTGNARGTPHVHFELHPGGGGAINPYPTLRSVC